MKDDDDIPFGEIDPSLLDDNNDDFLNKQNAEEDEEWISKLLSDDNDTEATNSKATSSSNSRSAHNDSNEDALESLLENIGATKPARTSKKPSAEIAAKATQRIDSQPKHSKSQFEGSIFNTLIWTLGSMLLIGLLIGQYVYFNFDYLAKSTVYRAALSDLCLSVGCTVPQTNTDLIKVDKQLTPAVADGEKSELVFSLTNTSDDTQYNPTLLINIKTPDQPVQLLVEPDNYMASYARLLLPHQKRDVRLIIDLPVSQVSDYQVTPIF